MTAADCRLCGKPSDLQESHILPAFVFRWMKESSATGYLRFGQEPNRRVQDGEKRYWLCSACEGLLSGWESTFASTVFHPLIADGGKPIRYGDWMLKFCASVSWRVLSLFVEDSRLDYLSNHQRAAIPRALGQWSGFILGREPHPGVHEQHFLPLDTVESFSGGEMPPNINRYLLRAVDFDLPASESGLIVYCKFAKFILLGFVDVAFPKQWVGTKVHVRDGLVGPGNFVLPQPFGDFIFSKCRRYAEMKAAISEKQDAKIAASMRDDMDRVAKSGSFEALHRDVELSGGDAFSPQKSREER